MSYSIPHTVGVQPDFKSVKHSDLSKCVLERPGATSLKTSSGEGALHRAPWPAVGVCSS